jgi:hypothetical protein
MDGSGIDFIIMPVIILPIVALWLGGIYYANAHPVWKNGPSDTRSGYGPQEIAVGPEPLAIPMPRTAPVTVPAQAKVVPATAVTASTDTAGVGDNRLRAGPRR